MITGYNTDIRHDDVVFHVQTEDKGLSNPLIETLVYVGGRVLAARRSEYGDLLAQGQGEKEIVALMETQHRKTIAAIRSGKLDEKFRQSGGATTGSQPVQVVPPAAKGASSEVRPPAEVPIGNSDRTLDQVILDYLTCEADQEQLLLMVDGEAQLGLGRQAVLSVRTSSSKDGAAVSRAQVAVKMISTVAEPRTLVSGRTDEEGFLQLSFTIPQLERGTAALIIVADSEIGTAEIKHLL